MDFIEESGLEFEGKKIMEVGAGNGGMSLYFVWQGAQVTCTDVLWRDNIFDNHSRYHVSNLIEYRHVGINQLSEYYENTFDVIVCKAVICGIGRSNNGNQKEGVHEIYRCLKDGGYFIFADSIKGTPLHAAARKLFGSNWQYFARSEIMELCSEFTLIREKYYGFLAPFTRIIKHHDRFRALIGKIDTMVFEHIIPNENRYIGASLFQKRELQKPEK